ncbi:uncharacterized protein LOC131934758 [Physella acuta]|uniref:uncharacterized protein LOC131934758 n=1 Tax=Physella acuta TaxID=109671 RepID=UPI0027DE8EF7|nr:uncharacterized protein LOC131934758 [Physella acuta]
MLAVTDDVIRTLSARSFALCLTMAVVCSFVLSVPVNKTETLFGKSQQENPIPMSIFSLRVIYICDESSSEYCAANKTGPNVTHYFQASHGLDPELCEACGTNVTCGDSGTGPANETRSQVFRCGDHVILSKRLGQNTSLVLNVTYHIVSGNFRQRLVDIDDIATSQSADVIVALGDALTVQTSALVAEGQGLPALGYIMEYGEDPKIVQGGTFVQLNPTPEAQGKALTKIIGQFNIKQTVMIVENNRMADGFLHGVRNAINFRTQDIFYVLALDSNIGRELLLQKLTNLSDTGWKIIALHCTPRLMVRVVTAALSTHLYNTGHAWFLSELAFSRDQDIIQQLPEGLLAIDSFWLGGIPKLMVKALDYVITATSCYLRDDDRGSNFSVPYDLKTLVKGNNSKVFYTEFRNVSDFPAGFKRCLRNYIVDSDNTSVDDTLDGDDVNSMSDNSALDSDYFKGDTHEQSVEGADYFQGPAFYLLNTVNNGGRTRIWAKVGYITVSGRRDLRTVLWPGHNIYGPSSNTVKTYRVVTRQAEPFVSISNRVARKEDCFVDVPCLQLKNMSQVMLTYAVDDFQTNEMRLVNDQYTIHCCKGLTLDILTALARDLNFRYIIYFVNDTDYGTNVSKNNVNWTGMVGDVMHGTADIIAGAFSATSERSSVIDFTEPFFQNQFLMVTAEEGHYVSIWAFMSPFSGQVWLCIFLSSIVAGIATAFLEWHSPFGLNPKGRKRTKNYGLGSGLLMVMVLLTGHTINIKAPKSWPGKVIQNVWAGLAIFIMTSYTANLAAYLAGQSAVSAVKSFNDPDLLTKRVAVMKSSSVEMYLSRINPKLGMRAKLYYVDSTISAIHKLRDRSIDVYLDDAPLLEFALVRYDKDCKIKLAGKGSSTERYAFGLPRHSWLKIPMSNQIIRYTESGFIQELGKKYLTRPQCEHFLSASANPYGLEHTGGLFIIMLSAVFLSVLFLVLEHLAYHFLVPWLRKQPPESFWKTENLAFISQRVFRVVRSEMLYSQKQAAQEMIKIVKQRDFTRLIQKNELQKRRANTQKRIKTKAEVFQEITANIVSYHRQLQSASETAENSEAEIDFENLRETCNEIKDEYDFDTLGVNNAAYTGDNSGVTLGQLYPRQTASSSDEDEDVFSKTRLGNSLHVEPSGNAGRKLSSRSLCNPPHSPEARSRKISDSFFLYYPRRHRHYVDSGMLSGVSHISNKSQLKESDMNCQVVSCAEEDRIQRGPGDTGDTPETFVIPPPSKGSVYYNSPTSSSLQSPIEEKREFSPLPSPTSPSTEDFPECTDSVCSSSTPSLVGSKNLVPRVSVHVHSDDTHPPGEPDPPHCVNCLTGDPGDTRPPSGELGTKLIPKTKNQQRTKIPRSASSDSVPRQAHSPTPRPQGGSYTDADICYRPHEGARRGHNGAPGDKHQGKVHDNMADGVSRDLPNNTKQRASFDKPKSDYFQRNLKLKDNRVKSTLRRHAMSGYQSHLPADFIDECTLEALSKEDVLTLWRKSEIDLESRLMEVMAKNRRLSLAIDFLTRQSMGGEPEEV